MYPDQGKVYFEGELLKPKHISTIGYLPEERGLYKGMRVGEQVLYLAQLKGLTKMEAKKRLKYWFERLDIGDWWNKKVQELSKGMAQKIQFIVTVLHEPKLLIFDEPFSGFDPINANIIKDEIINLKANGTSIIFSTHRMESVEELCEYITLIHQAEKILDGKLSDIKKAYKNNVFKVGLHAEDVEGLLPLLCDKFNIITSGISLEDNQLEFTIQIPTNDSGEILAFLAKRSNINQFVEIVPSVNEIFIQTIQDKDANE